MILSAHMSNRSDQLVPVLASERSALHTRPKETGVESQGVVKAVGQVAEHLSCHRWECPVDVRMPGP